MHYVSIPSLLSQTVHAGSENKEDFSGIIILSRTSTITITSIALINTHSIYTQRTVHFVTEAFSIVLINTHSPHASLRFEVFSLDLNRYSLKRRGSNNYLP